MLGKGASATHEEIQIGHERAAADQAYDISLNRKRGLT